MQTRVYAGVREGQAPAQFQVIPAADRAALRVVYRAREVGEYNAIMHWKQLLIPGSPFHIKVVAPERVRVVSGIPNEVLVAAEAELHGTQTSPVEWLLATNAEHVIEFDSSEAGPGIFFSIDLLKTYEYFKQNFQFINTVVYSYYKIKPQ